MRKVLLCALLAFGLVGCTAELEKFKQTIQTAITVYQKVTTTTVSPETIVVTATAFDGVKSVATTYLRTCKLKPALSVCAPGTRANPGPLRQVISWVDTGTSARNKLKPYITSGGAAPSDIYNTMVDAINSPNALPIAQAGGQ